ncbi:hypothetical protein C0Q70_13628 [Pomacea canaliculata]|uniref:Uncharacterized protein n=1 Tax=Pomacea canaliculata TaxID=400727 RepID=A0A2T7NXS1_POMCA|nr:hypothetical protein C0Q70_13628 [Pomacea canaliculata]
MEASVATRDAHALSLPSDTRQDGNNRVPKKEEPKVRQLDDGMLERLIAMNAFPPGTQGWVGIQAGAEKGGVYDEFVPLAMQQPLGNGYAKGTQLPNSTTRQPRGLAFEVRDDVITGVPINVPLHKPRNGASRNSSNSSNDSSNSSTGGIIRTSSADAINSDSEELRAYIVRANSMREELERQRQRRGEEAEDERHALDWSGTRLVRSGSFPEIPQDDSISDWTDNNVIGDGDEDDSVLDTPVLLGVDRVGEGVLAHSVYSAREDLSNMSDLTSSGSSSRSASPVFTNGPARVISPGPADLKAGTVIDLMSHLDNNANTKSISVSASTDDDMDC